MAKYISCKCKYKVDGWKGDSNQNCNDDKYRSQCKKIEKTSCVRKDCILNHSTCTCKNYKYLWSIIAISVVIYDEIIEVTKTVLTTTVSIKILQ